ncbi:TPA: tail fiber assembly protein [Morganella morganii]|nr:tail fiber assembly protein [Morganella morganii]
MKERKIYRVLLNRVDTSLGAAVVWPTPPASPASRCPERMIRPLPPTHPDNPARLLTALPHLA